jgi:hypothetical protein
MLSCVHGGRGEGVFMGGDWGASIRLELAKSVNKERKRWICIYIYAYCEVAFYLLLLTIMRNVLLFTAKSGGRGRTVVLLFNERM